MVTFALKDHLVVEKWFTLSWLISTFQTFSYLVKLFFVWIWVPVVCNSVLSEIWILWKGNCCLIFIFHHIACDLAIANSFQEYPVSILTFLLYLTPDFIIYFFYRLFCYYCYSFCSLHSAVLILLSPCCCWNWNYNSGITGKQAITSFKKVIVFITRCTLRMCTIHVDYNYFKYYLVKRIALRFPLVCLWSGQLKTCLKK
jgi:hypothetical protein